MSGLVPGFIRRFEAIVETAAGAHSPLRPVAQEASMRALWQARVELSMQALDAACNRLLEADSRGQPLNFDAKTARILMPLPWGKAGGPKWGLRSSEQRVLSQLMRWRGEENDALFVLIGRGWYVNRFSRERVLRYLTIRPIEVGEYRRAWEICAAKWSLPKGSAEGAKP